MNAESSSNPISRGEASSKGGVTGPDRAKWSTGRSVEVWRTDPVSDRPPPQPGYALARLEGGPLDGELILAPLEEHRRNLPARYIGVLAPVLHEDEETFA